MENNGVISCDKKFMSRVRPSNNTGVPLRLRGERRSFSVNEAVRSLDLALCRLQRGPPAPAGGAAPAPARPPPARPPPARRGLTMADVFADSKSVGSTYAQAMDNASLMSMNFSHYELMRNLSRSNCTSEGAFSGSASTVVSPTDTSVKDEHLERYFRSAEMWTWRCRDGPDSIRFNLPEK